jgi:hypothetical protein
MSKPVYYRQCKLRKINKSGTYTEQTSYIPEPFCVTGKVLKLKDSNDNWENGWIVLFASSNAILEPPNWHKEIKNHRKHTGDAMEKVAVV